jgi:hypothetical protein
LLKAGPHAQTRLLDIHAYTALEEQLQKAKYLPRKKGNNNFPDFTNLFPEVVYEGGSLLKQEAVKKEIVAINKYSENITSGTP